MYYNFPDITPDQSQLVSLSQSGARRLPIDVRRKRQALVTQLKTVFDRYGVTDRDERLEHLERLVDILGRLKRIHPTSENIFGYYAPLKTAVTPHYTPAFLLDLTKMGKRASEYVTPEVIESPDKYFFSYYDFIDVSLVKPLNPRIYYSYIHDEAIHISKESDTLLREYGYPLEITEENFYQFLPHQPKEDLTVIPNSPVYNNFQEMGDMLREQLSKAGFPLPRLRPNPGIRYSGGWSRDLMARYISRHRDLLSQHLTPQLAKAIVRFVDFINNVTVVDDGGIKRRYKVTGQLLLTLCHLIVTVKANPGFRLDASLVIDSIIKMQYGRRNGYGVARSLYLDLVNAGLFSGDKFEVFRQVTGITPSHGQLDRIFKDIMSFESIFLDDGSPHSDIGYLTGLKKLLIRPSLHISHPSYHQALVLPETIGQLSHLVKLDLDNYSFSPNKLSNLPVSIGGLTSLAKLSCANTNLTQLPETIGQLTGLTTLNLPYNKLTTLPESLLHLTSLHSLRLYGNPLEDIPPEFKDLQLYDNDIKKFLSNYAGSVTKFDGFNLEDRDSWDCQSSSDPSIDWLQTVTGTSEMTNRDELCEKLNELISSGLTCGLCYEGLLDGQALVVLPCNHLFHEEEFLEYAEGTFECPECGQIFKLKAR